MRLLLDQGLRSFVLALGGSATNDGGAGLLAELGADFFDSGGHRVAATARGLLHCAQVDFSNFDTRLADSNILALADVDNPLAGPSGASKTFGPQKGLANADTERVDAALARFGELCDAACGENLHNRPGSGAAGGLGYAVLLLGGKLVPGAVWLAQRYRLAEMIEGADWVITGEGRTDAQTLHGKAPLCVAEIARAAQVPVSLLSGRVDAGAWPQLSRLFHDYQALAESADDAAAMQEAAQRLERAAAVWAKIRKQEKSNPDSL